MEGTPRGGTEQRIFFFFQLQFPLSELSVSGAEVFGHPFRGPFPAACLKQDRWLRALDKSAEQRLREQ